MKGERKMIPLGRFSCTVLLAFASALIALSGCGGGGDAMRSTTTATAATRAPSAPSRSPAEGKPEHPGEDSPQKQKPNGGSSGAEHAAIPFREPTGPAPVW